MKNLLFFPGMLTLLLLLFPPFYFYSPDEGKSLIAVIEEKKRRAAGCSPGGFQEDLIPADASAMVPLPGWGSHSWKIKTTSDSAQFYFNQGINMYYSFHIIESLASFKKARDLDPDACMAWWGEALAYGPNINDVEYAASPQALAAIEKAAKLSASATPKELGLINAMLQRYSSDSSVQQNTLNRNYKEAMEKLYLQYKEDAEIGALYADAIMLIHPWDLYDHQSKPKPWTPELTAVLEKVLKINPEHPGANHYYIHAVEASLTPEKANASAAVLPGLMPMVSHVVHMPSHIYIRTGLYEKGSALNEKANKGYGEYLKIFPSVKNNDFLYLLHNVHMQATCAIMNGSYEYARQSSDLCKDEVPLEYLSFPAPTGEYVQYIFMTPFFNMVRYGKWNDILKASIMPDSTGYAKSLQHFARGMAQARLKNTVAAKEELQLLKSTISSDEKYTIKMGAFNSAYDAAEVAAYLLEGVIAEEENQLQLAENLLKKAVEKETLLIYNEPKDWLLPVRQYLGSVQLKARKFRAAEETFRADLLQNPLNGWSLRGLESALKGAGKKSEAEQITKNLKQHAEGKDFNQAWPVY